VIKRDTFHARFWDRDLKPALHIKPGDVVEFQVREVTSGLLNTNSKVEDYLNLTNPELKSQLYPLAGPVYIEGAAEGDTLAVDILDMKVADWGWSGLRPFWPPLTVIDIWDLSNGRYAPFKKGIKIPLRPFPGTIGVAPKEHGRFDHSVAYDASGGNMDIRYLNKGSRLMLPVLNDGALFSVGDPHAAQGDGELGTALESPAEITLRFELEKGKTIPSPQYFSSKRRQAEDSYFATTGSAPDLMEATKLAARRMIQYLMDEYDLTRSEALALCGLTADLRIHHVVDPPNWNLGLMIPTRVLEGKMTPTKITRK